MVPVENQFTEINLKMKISFLSTKLRACFPWQMQDQAPTVVNSSCALLLLHGLTVRFHFKCLMVILRCLTQRASTGKHCVFGSVTSGIELVKIIESAGTKGGKPTKSVLIQDCGQIA
jgi:cyclophilin family peptidyl-prolyl cis-trans isomerase